MKLMLVRLFFSLWICLFSVPGLAQTSDAGKVLFSIGNVSAQGSQQRDLEKGDTIFSGDTVITRNRSRAQLLMIDDARVAIRPNSEFTIAEYLSKPITPVGVATVSRDNGKLVLELAKGGFRTLTGKIGSNSDRQSYQVRTPVATVGIRGTDYNLLYCDGDCEDIYGGTGLLDDGLYAGVSNGGIWISNNGGSLDLDPGEYAFVRTIDTPPVKILGPPPGLFGESSGLRSTSREDESDDSSSDRKAASSKTGDGKSSDLSDRESQGDTKDTSTEDGKVVIASASTDSESSDSAGKPAGSGTDTASTTAGSRADGSSSETDDSVAATDPGSFTPQLGSPPDGTTRQIDSIAQAGKPNTETADVSGDSMSSAAITERNLAAEAVIDTSNVWNPILDQTADNFGLRRDAVQTLATSNGLTSSEPETTPPEQTSQPVLAETSSGSPIDLTPGNTQPTDGLNVAFTEGALTSVAFNSLSEVGGDQTRSLTQFTAVDIPPLHFLNYNSGDTQTFNAGFDPITGLQWGRWNEGFASIARTPINPGPDSIGATITLDLSQQSLHWISDTQITAGIQMPVSGTASYLLVGNTDPSNNLGQIGLMGSAQFSADFTQLSVSSDLSLGIGGQVWQASGTGSLGGSLPANQFSGVYNTVQINSVPGGSGEFAGFFTSVSNTGNTPDGVGLSYMLTNGTTRITGVSAFQLVQ